MTFNGPPGIESEKETTPTREEIVAVFEKLTGTKEYAELPLEDERGIYLWEIRVETKDGYSEYEYNRAVIDPPNKVPKTVIFATYYGTDGRRIDGETVAQLMNGAWSTNLIDLRTWLPK